MNKEETRSLYQKNYSKKKDFQSRSFYLLTFVFFTIAVSSSLASQLGILFSFLEMRIRAKLLC